MKKTQKATEAYGVLMATVAMFVVLEGMDGVGKTRIASTAVNRLRSEGICVHTLSYKDMEILAHEHRSKVSQLADAYVELIRHGLHRLSAGIELLAKLDASIYWHLYEGGVRLRGCTDEVVVADGWSYKSLAKHLLMLRYLAAVNRIVGLSCLEERVSRLFDLTFREDVGILVEASAEECYRRKCGRQSIFEDGTMIGLTGGTCQDFITFQELLHRELDTMAQKRHWRRIDNCHTLSSAVDQCVEFVLSKSRSLTRPSQIP